MKQFGIDTSVWNGDFDFKSAVENYDVEFAIIKAGGRSIGEDRSCYVDRQFNASYTKCKKQCLPVGCYWFANFTNEEECIEEANYFIGQCLRGRQFNLPIFVDVEADRMLALSASRLTDLVTLFCSRLESANYFVGIYSSLGAFKYNMDDVILQRFVHWVACWSTSCKYPYKESFGFWQFGGETNLLKNRIINGGIVDQNYMLIDYTQIIPCTGRNGYETKIDINKVVDDVIKGLYGVGVERRKKIESLGLSYDLVQSLVNERLK